jgi:trafficking protein particle complex subunit 2
MCAERVLTLEKVNPNLTFARAMSTPAPSMPPPSVAPSAGTRTKLIFTVINADDVPVYAVDLANAWSEARGIEAVRLDVDPVASRRLTTARFSFASQVVRELSIDDASCATTERDDYVFELIARGALDFVDERAWESNAAYLKVVDRFNDVNVYAYVTSTRVKFVLCAEMRADEPMRAFFADVHEGYCVAMMNPMRDEDAPLDTSEVFQRAVRAAARKRLGVV